MEKYQKPSLVSYKSQDISEIIGPAHGASPDELGLHYMFLALPTSSNPLLENGATCTT